MRFLEKTIVLIVLIVLCSVSEVLIVQKIVLIVQVPMILGRLRMGQFWRWQRA